MNSVRLENHMIRTFRLVPTIALAVALLGGAAYAQTIKIGVNEPLTGAFAASGTYVVNGAKIAADEINAKGGINGQKVVLVKRDDEAKNERGAQIMQEFLDKEKVIAVLGPTRRY